MESKELRSKIFTTSAFYRHVKTFLTHFPELLKSRKTDNVSKAFSEKIMLAVTQVNGCRLCNYVHTKSAINEGISEEEINALLNGELGDIGKDETLALMFAQHYADTDGNTDKQAYAKFASHYGEQKARDIMVSIRTIMIGNIYGISMDALQARIKGKKMKDSKLIHEIGILLGIFIIIPIATIHVCLEKIFK